MKRLSSYLCPLLLMALFLLAGCQCPARGEEAKAAPAPEQYFLVPSSQIVSQPINPLPQPVTGARAELVPIESEQPAAPSPSAKGGIMDILNSPALITLFATVAVMILKFLDDKKNLDAEKWTGLVYKLYNVGEQAGITHKLPGHEKLRLVMGEFSSAFERTYGHPPTRHDKEDMENDLAAVAYDDETTLNARRLKEAREYASLGPVQPIAA